MSPKNISQIFQISHKPIFQGQNMPEPIFLGNSKTVFEGLFLPSLQLWDFFLPPKKIWLIPCSQQMSVCEILPNPGVRIKMRDRDGSRAVVYCSLTPSHLRHEASGRFTSQSCSHISDVKLLVGLTHNTAA
jgi:hypothetical protein